MSLVSNGRAVTGGSAFHWPKTTYQQGQLSIPNVKWCESTVIAEEAPRVRAALKESRWRLAEETYHLMHVMAVVVASFLAVTIEEILGLQHFPGLLNSA